MSTLLNGCHGCCWSKAEEVHGHRVQGQHHEDRHALRWHRLASGLMPAAGFAGCAGGCLPVCRVPCCWPGTCFTSPPLCDCCSGLPTISAGRQPAPLLLRAAACCYGLLLGPVLSGPRGSIDVQHSVLRSCVLLQSGAGLQPAATVIATRTSPTAKVPRPRSD